VRLPKDDPDQLRPFLDMGAGGILAPFVTTAEEACLGTRALRYLPISTRVYSLSRASRYGFTPDYFYTADAEW
jgi:2-keto-3-deoxy-L-rhamnonate aldolase RhmA